MVPGVTSSRSTAPDHPDLVVQHNLGAVRKERKTYVIPRLSPGVNLRVFNPDIVTLEKAIKERVFYVKNGTEFVRPPLPTQKYESVLGDFSRALRAALPSTTPITRHEFADMYRGRRQQLYRNAADSLMTLGIRLKDSYICAFVKAEKGKPDSAPRVIQPRHPRYNVEVGRYLKPIEGLVYAAIAKVWGEKTVSKGMNGKQVGALIAKKWGSFLDPVALGLDASRFDQHVSMPALQWEHAQYLSCFPNPECQAELARLLRMQLRNKGFGYCSDGKLKYTTQGCRMSGDMNTALGNCLLMCAMVWTYARKRGVHCKLINNGDDCVVFMERRDLTRFTDNLDTWFTSMGFTMVAEPPVYNLEQVEFCQSHPVFDGDHYTMVRNLNAFGKDVISLLPLTSPGPVKKWLQAVGDGGMSLTGGIPIWQEFYQAYLRSAGHIESSKRRRGAKRKFGIMDTAAMETGMMMLANGMTRTYCEITPQARFSFWIAYGVSPDQQVAIERLLQERVICPEVADADMPFQPLSGFFCI